MQLIYTTVANENAHFQHSISTQPLKMQEALLPQTDHATRCVSRILAVAELSEPVVQEIHNKSKNNVDRNRLNKLYAASHDASTVAGVENKHDHLRVLLTTR